ncbi:MAG TPA: flavin reductase family protein [Marinospirillum sp.]|uniref:flavin reductase family protein n=1 Tax=Marinospirillum sp. TaxID=2183934 RepID=UPI002B49B841|nr:flavin reductase family protein [Marinospirillum sp.]HKM15703.1 flavin reductase family protein [Marinospirillum sp.]
MQLDLAQLKPDTCYHLMTQTLIPRPIAWVLSASDNGELNLAPFSFFNGVCSDPPIVMLSIGKKTPEEAKDTRHNILSGRDFVIHIPSTAHAADVTASATSLPYGESELTLIQGNQLVEFAGCPLPRLKSAPVAFQAKLHDVHYLGTQQQAVIYAELIQAYIADDVVEVDEAKGRYTIDANKINPLARLGGAQYVGIDEVFSIIRPA